MHYYLKVADLTVAFLSWIENSGVFSRKRLNFAAKKEQ